MSDVKLAERHERLQRKLAACYAGWHSGRIDRLEESLRSIERQLGIAPGASRDPGQYATRH